MTNSRVDIVDCVDYGPIVSTMFMWTTMSMWSISMQFALTVHAANQKFTTLNYAYRFGRCMMFHPH